MAFSRRKAPRVVLHSCRPVCSTAQLQPVEIVREGGGTVRAVVRDSIRRDVYDRPDGSGVEFWTADEVELTASLPAGEVFVLQPALCMAAQALPLEVD